MISKNQKIINIEEEDVEEEFLEEENDNYEILPIHKINQDSISKCFSFLENEKSFKKLRLYADIMDESFGGSPDLKANQLIKFAKNNSNQAMLFVDGYAHFLIAEKLYKDGHSKKEINFENEKAIYLLAAACLDGKSKYLDRAVSLKRKVNFKKFILLCFDCVLILIIVTIIVYIIRLIQQDQLDFL